MVSKLEEYDIWWESECDKTDFKKTGISLSLSHLACHLQRASLSEIRPGHHRVFVYDSSCHKNCEFFLRKISLYVSVISKKSKNTFNRTSVLSGCLQMPSSSRVSLLASAIYSWGSRFSDLVSCAFCKSPPGNLPRGGELVVVSPYTCSCHVVLMASQALGIGQPGANLWRSFVQILSFLNRCLSGIYLNIKDTKSLALILSANFLKFTL